MLGGPMMGTVPMGLGITLIVFSPMVHLALFHFPKHKFSLSPEQPRDSEKSYLVDTT